MTTISGFHYSSTEPNFKMLQQITVLNQHSRTYSYLLGDKFPDDAECKEERDFDIPGMRHVTDEADQEERQERKSLHDPPTCVLKQENIQYCNN